MLIITVATPTRRQKFVYQKGEIMKYRDYYEYEKNYVELPTDIDKVLETIADAVDSIGDIGGKELTIRLAERLLKQRAFTCCCDNQNEWVKDELMSDDTKTVFRHRRYNGLAMIVEGSSYKYVDLNYNMIWDNTLDVAIPFKDGAKEVSMPYRVPRDTNLYEEHKFTNGVIKRVRYEL